jgi:hypothetical protein
MRKGEGRFGPGQIACSEARGHDRAELDFSEVADHDLCRGPPYQDLVLLCHIINSEDLE